MRKEEVTTLEALALYAAEIRGDEAIDLDIDIRIDNRGNIFYELSIDHPDREMLEADGDDLKAVIKNLLDGIENEWGLGVEPVIREITPTIVEVTPVIREITPVREVTPVIREVTAPVGGITGLEQQLKAAHDKFAAELAGELAPGIREVKKGNAVAEVAPGIREVITAQAGPVVREIAPGIHEVATQAAPAIREITPAKQTRPCCGDTRQRYPGATRCNQCGRPLL